MTIKKLICRLRGHMWERNGHYRRKCKRCGRQQEVMYQRFPKIGESQYNWRDRDEKQIEIQ